MGVPTPKFGFEGWFSTRSRGGKRLNPPGGGTGHRTLTTMPAAHRSSTRRSGAVGRGQRHCTRTPYATHRMPAPRSPLPSLTDHPFCPRPQCGETINFRLRHRPRQGTRRRRAGRRSSSTSRASRGGDWRPRLGLRSRASAGRIWASADGSTAARSPTWRRRHARERRGGECLCAGG